MIRRLFRLFQCHEGFGLLEVAMALMVVGMLYGAGLCGHELIESARMQSVVQQIQTYQRAVQQFRDQYRAWPGDFKNASTYWSDAKNGDGDGKIKGKGLEEGQESVHFWSHLAFAGLIADVSPQGEAAFGQGVPASSLGGGWTVEQDNTGIWLILGAVHSSQGTGALLTPQQVQSLFKRLGVMAPHTPWFRAEKGANATGECLKNGSYDLSHKQPACIVKVFLGH